MVTWTDYFECAGALLGIYGVFRIIIWLQFRNDFPPPPPSKPSNIQSHTIDTSPLAHRLKEVRRGYAAEPQARPVSEGKPLLVAERREEVAKLAFFQR